MSVPPEGYLIPRIQNQSIWHFYGRSSEGCQYCATSKKILHVLSDNLFFLLPIPNRPWSHLSRDFITDLPSLHSSDAFIQSDLQCIQAIHILVSTCVPWESNPLSLRC